MEFLRNKFIATIKIESFDNRIIIRFLIEKKSSVDKMDRQKKDSKEAWFGKNRFRGDNWRISSSRRGIHKERRGNQRLMHYTYWGNLRQVSALRLPPPSPSSPSTHPGTGIQIHLLSRSKESFDPLDRKGIPLRESLTCRLFDRNVQGVQELTQDSN